ncbi:UDP-N-acetylmuramoyl-tripeptide--D-alanyl-D-alanine ligase [Salinispira pacifica]|uniref:UDP-N-acetylmuramoyl-tripeptide--D-alanyl-D-alanine ligase n=1 Tax=Salinispira pacifica TaxID=1307761 RepID=V5WG24_9SPIO|nr:UDP-N-acetylmuramoyl-tripeptide--D-alanyl-D-alanine ligase [Salinispira pacifica]AHC14560.1 UDP-N-acetylmuramoylalanyl-D-glutamyl-2,6- diaminopimelate--D-alanyl-D-alanine ligase [Salinispira pacifica]
MAGYPVALSQDEFIRRVKKDSAWRAFILDSRQVSRGDVFFALQGERVNGHSYIPQAIEAGARAVVLQRHYFENHQQSLLEAAGLGEHCDESPLVLASELSEEHDTVVFVSVESPLECLQAAGAAVLAMSGGFRIGITGSNGKTGTKDLLASVLSRKGDCFSRKGNFNSVIGLPVLMAQVPVNTDYTVMEMAMSEKGEMETLSRLVRPNAALITNIGTAHIGNIGSREGIAEEKFQIFSSMTEDGVAVLPDDDPWAMKYLEEHPLQQRILYYGLGSRHGFSILAEDVGETVIAYQGGEFRLPFSGRHMLHNTAGVITLARQLGLSDSEIQEGLNGFQLPQGRGNIIRGHSLLIDDSYNANADSMAAAIEQAAQVAVERQLVLILGDMLELGDYSDEHHRDVLSRAMDAEPSAILLLGEYFSRAADHLGGAGLDPADSSGVHAAADIEELKGLCKSIIQSGSAILLKGSRGMELERIIPFLPGLEQERESGGKPGV